MMVSFCAVFFPRGVLDEILNLIESVSEGFPSYSCREYNKNKKAVKFQGDMLNFVSLFRFMYLPQITTLNICNFGHYDIQRIKHISAAKMRGKQLI